MPIDEAESGEPRAKSRTEESGHVEVAPTARHRGLSALSSRLSALFGMPDYRRYLAHQMTHHPTEPVLSEKEFVRAELERKYAGGGSRCC